MTALATDLVQFWRDAGPERWFRGGKSFDAACREQWMDAHMRASRGELDHWMDTLESAFALILLCDQLPRNMFRGSAHAYATDPLGRAVADHAIARGFDRDIDPEMRRFFYLPFTHAEDAALQQRSVDLHRGMPGEEPDKWALHHQAIITRFGRFPHRNPLFGRTTTAEEQAWLDADGFSG
ncbi:MAG: DUF924 family protein [Dokdonella sp.]